MPNVPLHVVQEANTRAYLRDRQPSPRMAARVGLMWALHTATTALTDGELVALAEQLLEIRGMTPNSPMGGPLAAALDAFRAADVGGAKRAKVTVPARYAV